MNRDRTIQICALLVALSAIVGSGFMSIALTAEGSRAQLSYTDTAQAGDPPEISAAIALGSFRGLFVNYLWSRANTLKDEGKYYEAMELSRWITRLQPRFPRVWAFHAWNMAYNISVATNTSEERWQWVDSGIDLIRSEGLRYNPNDMLLYKELGWILFHKVDGFADDANRYYKREFAREWTIVLGTPPEAPERRQEAIDLYAQWLTPVAQAPRTRERLIQLEVQEALAQARTDEQIIAASTSKVQQLIERIETDAELELGYELLELITMVEAYRAAWHIPPEQRDAIIAGSALNQSVIELYDDPQYANAWQRLVPFVRSRVLSDVYNMSALRMLRYTNELGPMDWRIASTHALYWSRTGVEKALTRAGTTGFETINTDRNSIHSAQHLFREGALYYDITTNDYSVAMNLAWAEGYDVIVREATQRNDLMISADRGWDTFKAGYTNFYADLIRVYYGLGYVQDARRVYEMMAGSEFLVSNNPGVVQTWSQPLDEFVQYQRQDRLSTPQVALSEVSSAVRMAFVRGSLAGDRDAYERYMKYAGDVHTYYYTQQDAGGNANPDQLRMEIMPRSFSEAVGENFMQFALQQGNPWGIARVYNTLPAEIQRTAYDPLIQMMAQQFESEEHFNLFFPRPAGLDQYRQMLQIRQQQRRDLEGSGRQQQ